MTEVRASQRKAEEKESRMTEVSNGCKQGSSEMRSLLAQTQEEPQVGQGDGEWRLGSLRFKASVMRPHASGQMSWWWTGAVQRKQTQNR